MVAIDSADAGTAMARRSSCERTVRGARRRAAGNVRRSTREKAFTTKKKNRSAHKQTNRRPPLFRAAPEGFTKLPTLFTHCAQKTTPTNQLFPGPSARSAGPANQPPGPARVLPGSPTGQKFLRSAYSTRRTSKWVKMGYFTPLQAPRSIFSPLSILKLRHEGHSGLSPVRRAGVPGEGAVTTVTAWPTVTRVREVRDQPTNIWRPGVRRMGDHPTNPGPGVGE